MISQIIGNAFQVGIITSNLGPHEVRRHTQPLRFSDDPEETESLKTSVVEGVKAVTNMYLDGILHTRLRSQGKELRFHDSAVEYLAREGFSNTYGARFLTRKIDELVKIPITLKWKEKNTFELKLGAGQLVTK